MRNRLLKSVAVIATMTLVSRVLGFVRDVVFAQLFGASAGFDAFIVAFRISNLGRRLFAEGAFSQSFVPLLVDKQASSFKSISQPKLTTDKATPSEKAFISDVSGTLMCIVLFITVCAIFASPLLIKLIAPGFRWGSERFDLAKHLLRITMPYLWFIACVSMASSILNCHNRFALPAATPILLNLSLITFAALGMYSKHSFVLLAWGVPCAGCLQLLVLLPSLRTLGLFPLKVCWGWRKKDVQRLVRMMGPILIAGSVVQIGTMIDTIFASFLVHGSVTWLYFAERLFNLPLGLFGIALSTAILPYLSKQYVANDEQAFSHALDFGMRWILLIATPASIGLMLLAGPIIATLFYYHAFNPVDVRMTKMALHAFAIGLPAFMLMKVLTSACYARQESRIVLRTALLALCVNIIANALLIVPLHHAGLALATSIAAGVQVFGLLHYLIKHKYYSPGRYWLIFGGRLSLASSFLIAWLMVLSPHLRQWLHWSGYQRIIHLSFLILGGVLIYAMSLWVMGIRMRHLRSPILR